MKRILLIAIGCLIALFAHSQRKSIVPYRVVAGKMLVDIKINGKTCPVIFDTGGTTGIIDTECERLNLTEDGEISVVDVTDTRITYPRMRAKKLAFLQGNMKYEHVSIMKMSTPSPVERFGAVGLLGSDLLVNNIVEIDSKKQVIVITSAEQAVREDASYMQPFFNETGACPWITFETAGRKIKALFDTGACYFLSLSESDYRELYSWNGTKILEKGIGRGPSGVGGGYIPRVEKKRVSIAPITVGKARFDKVVVDELTAAHTIFGLPILKYGKAVIDYSRRQLFFIPYREEAEVENELYDITFSLKKPGMDIIVESVWGDLKKKIKLGDRLLKINGKDIGEFDAMELIIKGIPAVTRREENLLTIETKGGEEEILYKKIDF